MVATRDRGRNGSGRGRRADGRRRVGGGNRNDGSRRLGRAGRLCGRGTDGSSGRGVRRLGCRRSRGGRRLGDGRKLTAGRGVTLDLAVAYLANGDGHSGGNNLGLAVLDDRDESGRNHGGANDVAARGDSRSVAARKNREVDGRTLLGPVAVVEVVEVTREAAVESGRSTESEGTVLADREARRVDDASLGRSVKLELEVGNNGSGAALGVGEDTVLEGEVQRALLTAVGGARLTISLVGSSMPLKMAMWIENIPQDCAWPCQGRRQ